MSHLQGLSCNGYVSVPPLPEDRTANRLHAEAQKAKKDAEKEARERKRKRKRKEAHEKENRRREREGLLPLSTPESTPEPDDDSSPGDEDLNERVTVSSPPAQ